STLCSSPGRFRRLQSFPSTASSFHDRLRLQRASAPFHRPLGANATQTAAEHRTDTSIRDKTQVPSASSLASLTVKPHYLACLPKKNRPLLPRHPRAPLVSDCRLCCHADCALCKAAQCLRQAAPVLK